MDTHKTLASRIEQVRKNSRLPAYQQAELTEIKVALLKLANEQSESVVPTIEWVSTEKEFKGRLALGDEQSDWYSHYSGVFTHRFKNGQVWAVGTQYWDGSLPTEVPFRLVNLPTDFKAMNEY